MIVVFGGAFNPPTIAHKKVVKHVLELESISKLILVPVGDHYPKEDLVSAFHRVQMLQLMTRKLEGAEISVVEVIAGREMKSIETMTTLKQMHPKEELAFLMGADNVHDLLNWHEYEQFVSQFKILMLRRNDLDTDAFIQEHFSTLAHQFILIGDFLEIDMSSTEFRVDPKKKHLVCEEVLKYIETEGLYK